VSGDGSIIGGRSSLGPMLWVHGARTMTVASILAASGISTSGLYLIDINGMSADGHTVVGNCTLNGSQRGWYLQLSPGTLCSANCDASVFPPRNTRRARARRTAT
jgi:hypothetical protein